MTHEDWLEIVEWIDQRFTRGWTPDQAVAYYDDLKQWKAEDIWDALYRLYDRGLQFPPNGSELRSEVKDVVRDRMERARYESQGLPAPTNKGMGWADWHERLGLPERWQDAVELAHKRIYPRGCPFSGCELCGNLDSLSSVT